MNASIRFFDSLYKPHPVVHFPNTRSATSGDAGGYDKLLHMLAPRMQATLGRDDVVIYNNAVVANQRRLAAHHREIGLGNLPDDKILGLPGNLEDKLTDNFRSLDEEGLRELRELTEASRRADARFVPYIHSNGSEFAAQQLGLTAEANADAGYRLNNKLCVKESINRLNDEARRCIIAQPLGLPVPTPDAAPGIFKHLQAMAASDPRSDGRIWCKLACSGGGQGVKAIKNLIELEAWLELSHVQRAFRPGLTGGVLMDIGIKAREKDASPSANIYVGRTPAEDKFLLGSYQLLVNDKDWIGNIGPLSPTDAVTMNLTLAPIFAWLRAQGAYGLCGADFIVGTDGCFYLIEFNYRITGAMAAGFIARERGAKVWAAANEISVPWDTSVDTYVSHLMSQDILLGPDNRSAGVFLLNNLPALGLGNAHPVVQGGVIATSREQAVEMIEAAKMAA